ncbi:MAG: polyprenol monophosphomannose synthase [Candidatus Aenigmarchaeota archaeon]|nr:polyprenol monophosphomannose synthase [Candidatus Aenigmarchaeota archaeon]
MARVDISIVLPTYNERENIVNLIPEIAECIKNTNYEIVVVDDNSPDGTAEAAEKFKNARVVRREKKMGIGTAYKAGFDAAHGKIIVTMDADMSHNPKYVQSMINKINEGHDIVVGSRHVEGGAIVGWGINRKIISGIANGLTHFFLGIKVSDVTSGYRAYRKELLKKMPLDNIKSSGYSYLLETIFYAVRFGKIAEVPIVFEDRKAGKSKLGKNEYVKYVKTVGRLFVKRIKG